jgi:hypothetical protein
MADTDIDFDLLVKAGGPVRSFKAATVHLRTCRRSSQLAGPPWVRAIHPRARAVRALPGPLCWLRQSTPASLQRTAGLRPVGRCGSTRSGGVPAMDRLERGCAETRSLLLASVLLFHANSAISDLNKIGSPATIPLHFEGPSPRGESRLRSDRTPHAKAPAQVPARSRRSRPRDVRGCPMG